MMLVYSTVEANDQVQNKQVVILLLSRIKRMVYVLDYSTNCGSKWSLKQTSGYSQAPYVQNKEDAWCAWLQYCGSKWSLKQISSYSQTPSVQNKEDDVLGYSTVEANGV